MYAYYFNANTNTLVSCDTYRRYTLEYTPEDGEEEDGREGAIPGQMISSLTNPKFEPAFLS
jgi:hypothetical protein